MRYEACLFCFLLLLLLFSFVAIDVVTLHTFALGKLDLLTVFLGKLNFSSVTDFFLGNLPGEIYRLELGYLTRTMEFPLTATPAKARARANSNPKVTNQWTLLGGCVDDRNGNL